VLFAKAFTLLSPYRKYLMEEAYQYGFPLVRALFLHYPKDLKSKYLKDQFLFGSDFMVKPILDRSTTKTTVYLPGIPRGWVYIWDIFKVYGANGESTTIEIDAPMGFPPVFYKANSKWGADFAQDLNKLNYTELVTYKK